MEAVLSGRDSLLVLPTGGGKSLCFQAPAHRQRRPRPRRLAAHLADEGSGRHARRQRRAGGLLQQLAAVGAEDARSRAACATGGIGCCTSRPSGWSATAATASSTCCRRGRSASSRSTKRTASASGATTSVRSTASSRGCASAGRRSACTPTPRPRPRACGATSSRSSACAIPPSWSDRSIGRTWSIACCARSTLKTQILDVLERHRGQAGIIYCSSRKEVDALAQWLQDTGWRARPYHAGMADEDRHRNQDAFLNEEIDIVVATVAFGMGIDRSDVRFVIHAGAPQSLEHYQQESGRAGRDGLEAECVLIASGADFLKWRVDAREERRAVGRAPRPAARHRALRRQRRLPPPAPRRLLRRGVHEGRLRRVRLLPRRARDGGRRRSRVARKILSCVARVGQRFGAAHVTNVLRGSDSEQVRSRGHHELSVFGLMKDATIDEVRGYIDQLLAHGLLQQARRRVSGPADHRRRAWRC